MVSIQGLGGIPEPKPERPGKVRNDRDSSASVAGANAKSDSGAREDDVAISGEARAAADVARIIQVSKSNEDIRAERVEAARAAIERGDYKNPDIVRKVAERIAKLIS
ncbi:MAG: flagellar biosynthesis anti-sigma factor FlgM [Candidatus Hydrogenedentes bacterium]|nr:flagellar biosynthesis anti-sigma factor FlgM [Candidatus Hydrogenedentota bacterium]